MRSPEGAELEVVMMADLEIFEPSRRFCSVVSSLIVRLSHGGQKLFGPLQCCIPPETADGGVLVRTLLLSGAGA